MPPNADIVNTAAVFCRPSATAAAPRIVISPECACMIAANSPSDVSALSSTARKVKVSKPAVFAIA